MMDHASLHILDVPYQPTRHVRLYFLALPTTEDAIAALTKILKSQELLIYHSIYSANDLESAIAAIRLIGVPEIPGGTNHASASIKDKEDRRGSVRIYRETVFQPTVNGKNTIGNLIDWMKTAPPWAGDDFDECLEYVNRTRK